MPNLIVYTPLVQVTTNKCKRRKGYCVRNFTENKLFFSVADKFF